MVPSPTQQSDPRSGLSRYGPGARWYDTLSGERWVYRAGRVAGIDQLRLQTGDQVLDIGCGTGLNFPLLVEGTGLTGTVVGVDASQPMLDRAQARIDGERWATTELIRSDAEALTTVVGGRSFDAALFTYSLSIFDRWQDVLTQTLRCVRPGGRVVVVDMTMPTGVWTVLAPLARLAMLTGGADPRRRPWQALCERTDDTSHQVLRGGHVHVGAGTVRTRP